MLKIARLACVIVALLFVSGCIKKYQTLTGIGKVELKRVPSAVRMPAAAQSKTEFSHVSAVPLSGSLVSTIPWKSFSPDSVRVPIVDIAISGDGGAGEASLYACDPSTPGNCLLELADTPEMQNVLNSAIANIVPGTYTEASISTCRGTGYDAKIKTAVTINGTRFVTTPTGLKADPDALAEEATVHYSGCKRTYKLPAPVTIAEGTGVTLQLYFDDSALAWAAQGAVSTHSAWIPSGCTGSSDSSFSQPFVCMNYPDVAATLDAGLPITELYRVNGGALFELFFTTAGDILGGYTRRFLAENQNPPVGFSPETPLKAYSRNADDTFTIESFGSTADGPGYFKTTAFHRKDHTGTYTLNGETTPFPYTAVKLADSDPVSQLPSCPSAPPFTVSPIVIADIYNMVPLGNINPPGHVFPSDHQGFCIREALNASGVLRPVQTDVVAPGDAAITIISEAVYFTSAHVETYRDYAVTLNPCREISVSLGHLSGLAADFVPDPATWDTCGESDHGIPGGPIYRYCSKNVNIPVTAGRMIASAGGDLAGEHEEYGVDMVAFDTRIAPLAYVNPSRLFPDTKHSFDGLHIICAVDLFTGPTRTQLENLIGGSPWPGQGVFTPANGTPRCWKVMQDVAGTIQGNWYQQGTVDNYDWSRQLAFVHDMIDTTIAVYATGGGPLGADYRYFRPIHSGHIDREFSEVTADSSVYCYNMSSGNMSSGRILVRLDNTTQLTVEKQAGACEATSSFSLSGAYIYER